MLPAYHFSPLLVLLAALLAIPSVYKFLARNQKALQNKGLVKYKFFLSTLFFLKLKIPLKLAIL